METLLSVLCACQTRGCTSTYRGQQTTVGPTPCSQSPPPSNYEILIRIRYHNTPNVPVEETGEIMHAPFGCDRLQVNKAWGASENFLLHILFQALLRQAVPKCNTLDKTLDVIQCCNGEQTYITLDSVSTCYQKPHRMAKWSSGTYANQSASSSPSISQSWLIVDQPHASVLSPKRPSWLSRQLLPLPTLPLSCPFCHQSLLLLVLRQKRASSNFAIAPSHWILDHPRQKRGRRL